MVYIAVAAILVAVLLVAGLTLLLTRNARSTAVTASNTITLSGAVAMSAKITPSCKLGSKQTTYAVSATFASREQVDGSRDHFQLSFSIEAYKGPGTYLARDHVLDKVVLNHIGIDPSGHAAADATYVMADMAGSATVNDGGLSGSINQDVAAVWSSGERIHVSATWQCGHLEQLPQTSN